MPEVNITARLALDLGRGRSIKSDFIIFFRDNFHHRKKGGKN